MSNLGDGIGVAAAPLLVASRTRDPFLVTLAPLLQRLPWLLFGLLAGALADRLNRKRMVVVVDTLRAVTVGGLAFTIAVDRASIGVVLGVVFLFGLCETFADTATSTILPNIVDKADLGIGNSRLITGYITVNELAGPPVGAALFAAGAAWPFAGQAVCVAAAVGLISRIRTPLQVEAGERRPIGSEIADGFRWLWGHPAVRTLALTIFTFNITFGAAWSVLVLYAQDRLHMGDLGFGLLSTASAIGGIISTSRYGWLERRFSLGTLMRICLSLEVLCHLAFALATEAWMGLVIMFGFGMYAFVWATVSGTVRQRAVPTEFQGRVGSVYTLGVFGGIAIGNLLGGIIAARWGVAAPFWFAFVATAVILAFIWNSLPQIAHAGDTTPPPT